jgi:RNA polymerase sigma-70 factor (ECF subfamily)
MTERTDAELMARIQAGDREAFAAVVDRYKDPLVGYLSHLACDRDRAEDLAQESFIRLYQNAGEYREQGRLAPWLYRIATNLLRSEERRSRRWWMLRPLVRVNGHTTAMSPQTEILRDETRRKVTQALARLPVHYRAPLVLREVEDWSYEQIARATGCPEGTVKSRINRARAHLKRELAPYWNGGAS